MTLLDLKPGQRSRIQGWTTDQPPSRLMELGILPGTDVELVRFAPLGDPIDIKVRGYHLSIRKSEAALIRIERP
ncbi:MAG: FeoA family protein [Bacteroidetes bacterium]|nr:FeoA family protein [Bacteroidota bacterium]MDA1333757.1 FeoA family protein [Bacteroidota bacterium]